MSSRVDKFTVSVTDTIKTAMLKITANRHRAVVVLDGKRVVGTVSDGDIRRALLRGILPMATVEGIMNINCITTKEKDRRKLADIIRRKKVTVLPIVTDKNELVDLFLAYEPFVNRVRSLQDRGTQRSTSHGGAFRLLRR